MKRSEGAKTKGKPIVYWDSCLFIDWLKGVARALPGENDGLEEQIRQFEANEITVVTSVLTVVEVLESYVPDEHRPKLVALHQMPDKLYLAQVGYGEANAGHEIRDHFKRVGGLSALTVTTADAIHLATAIVYECDVFYTFDREDRKDDEGVKSLGLLPLSGHAAVRGLRIEKPPPPAQGELKPVRGEAEEGEDSEEE